MGIILSSIFYYLKTFYKEFVEIRKKKLYPHDGSFGPKLAEKY